ncbi:MAG TPA: YceI family protein [Thiomicrorhabdus sp.]|nr:YceI family protein [Thiomicrorhabdus sp.]
MVKLYTALLVTLLTTSNVYAGWLLKNSESNVYYVSTKNLTTSELNYFNTLTGNINDQGDLTIKINLESVETDVPIRNERIKSMLFEVINYGKATVTASIDPEKLKHLKIGETYTESVNFMLNLHGINQELSTTVKVIKSASGNILVTPVAPIIISANLFGLEKGIERLRKIARLKSISPSVPVTFNLTFYPPN